jgi:hypothetical protein
MNQSPLDANPVAYINNEDLHSYNFSSLSQLLSVVQIRHLITQRRWEKFLQSGAQMQVHGSVDPGVFKETIAYNIEGITNSVPVLASLIRSELVFRPVMCLDHIYSYQSQSVFPHLSVLLIGSRTEFEVLTAFSYGILPSKLSAVDLISYSPWITPGDMHNLPYAENSFDLIIMGWTMNYTNTPAKVGAEIVRVAKPGAVFSIGNDCYTKEFNKTTPFGYNERPQTMPDLLRCFGGAAGKVFFAQEPNYPKQDLPGFMGHLIATFEIKK